MMAQRAIDHGALAARLSGLTARAQGFAAPARAQAAQRLAAMGLPQKRDEYWRYSDPAPLNDALTAVPPQAFDDVFADRGALRIVFRNGRFDAAASDDLSLAGVVIAFLDQAEGADIHWAQSLYGQLETAGQTPVPRPFASLNTAYAQDGILLHITAKVQRAISVIYLYDTNDCDPILHHCLKVDAGAEVTLLEQGAAGARSNILWEIDLAAGAVVHHIRTQLDHSTGLSQVFARLDAGARLKSFTLAAHAPFARRETVLTLRGDGASAHVAGANLTAANLTATGQHQDDTVFITHQGRACESRQVFKNVLRGGAVGVFQGKILVQAAAQKTDGYQISQALLLDGDSQFLAKPELEIYADDVKCSHGSTSGAIDETALFYLQSRGVPRAQAQALLVLAFLGAAMDEIADADLAEILRAQAEILLTAGG